MTNASGSLAVLRERYGERYRWLLLLSVMVGPMASIMSSTIVNVAIPDMSHYFTLGQERAQWVTSGFMVATTVSMLTTPWLLSRYGYRSTDVGAMLLLLAGGVGGGLARDFGLVLAASASYIAVPAVVRYAIPEAQPSLYVSLSLGVTFPLNIVLGIPLYTQVVQWAWVG